MDGLTIRKTLITLALREALAWKLQITKTQLSARGGKRRRRRRRGQRKKEKILLKVRAVKLEAVDARGECGRRER